MTVRIIASLSVNYDTIAGLAKRQNKSMQKLIKGLYALYRIPRVAIKHVTQTLIFGFEDHCHRGHLRIYTGRRITQAPEDDVFNCI